MVTLDGLSVGRRRPSLALSLLAAATARTTVTLRRPRRSRLRVCREVRRLGIDGAVPSLRRLSRRSLVRNKVVCHATALGIASLTCVAGDGFVARVVVIRFGVFEDDIP